VPTRLAVFSIVEWSFLAVRDWAARAGHELAIVVTLPVGASGLAGRLPALVDSDTIVMVVPTAEKCAAALRALEPDLGIVFTFRRIPELVAGIPRRGFVNVHPSLLPAYRGPNGLRSLYEGERELGATLHYLTPEFDAGPILAQASEPTPQDVEPTSALEVLRRTATAVLDEGVPRALAGHPGTDQDPSAATEAPRFSEREAVLDLDLTTSQFQARLSALSLAGIQPRVELEGEARPLRAARRLPGLTANGPGVIRFASRRATVAALDGVLELELGELPF
jgi:methionyl-tRNA formyltransferase